MGIMQDFVLGVVSSWVASVASRVHLDKFIVLPFARRTIFYHKRELREKLSAMPFIYKDLPGELLSDFVDVDIDTLDANTLSARKKTRIDITSEERLRQRRKAIFLGSAGIGKTTFVRHTILSLLNSSRKLKLFYPGEDFVPIYVPLKAVDNTAPSPIVRYVLQNVCFLREGDGFSRLMRLAEDRSLGFFFDGYDEIPFADVDDDKNYVRQELLLLMGSANFLSDGNPKIKSSYKSFYSTARGCRIWLTSRQEFFEQHSVVIATRGSAAEVDRDIVAIRIEGVGNNRVILAKLIFDKYRRLSAEYANILSEEYFIQEIDSAGDPELKSLSFNPLFLTVLCYTYVKRALEAGSHEVSMAESRVALVLECINLLLFDLDDTKAKEMPRAERAGLLRRRNEYREEKIQFLQFFAAQLFLEQKTSFSSSYLSSKVIEFFQPSQSPNADKIVRDMELGGSGTPNMAQQLIYSGVFVIVDKSAEGVLYDLPHRQFREILASAYFDHANTVGILLQNVTLKSLSELIILFFVRSRFQEEVLESLLAAARAHKQDSYFGALAVKCLEKNHLAFKPGRLLRSFFTDAVERDDYFLAPPSLLAYCDIDSEFVAFLADRARAALHSRKAYSFAVACELLLHYNRDLLNDVLASVLREPSSLYPEISAQVLYISLLTNVDIVANNFSWINKDKDWFIVLCYIIAAECYDPAMNDSSSLRRSIRGLLLKDFVIFLYMLWRYRWQESYVEPPDLSLHLHCDVAFAVVRNYPPKSYNRPDSKRDSDCYVITERAVRIFKDSDARKKMRLMKYNVFWSREALGKRLKALKREDSIGIDQKQEDLIYEAAAFGADDFIELVNVLSKFSFNEMEVIRVFQP